MKQGMTLTEMAVEIERQSRLKADFVVDTRERLALNVTEELALEALAYRLAGD